MAVLTQKGGNMARTARKSKPSSKPQLLEQKRAVVLEPQERKAVTLIAQLNALRNERAAKRRAGRARQRQVGPRC